VEEKGEKGEGITQTLKNIFREGPTKLRPVLPEGRKKHHKTLPQNPFSVVKAERGLFPSSVVTRRGDRSYREYSHGGMGVRYQARFSLAGRNLSPVKEELRR